MDGDRLLNTSVDDLANYFAEKHSLDAPSLVTDEIVADQREVEIDVSQDRNRTIFDRSRPFHITGTEILVHVPFTGDAKLFGIQPSSYTMNPPRGSIQGQQLVLVIQGIDLAPGAVRAQVDQRIAEIEQSLTVLRRDAEALNSQLKAEAQNAIDQRRRKLLADRNLIGALGFKMKERGQDRTFAAPNVRRKLLPTLPAAATAPFKPEPTLPVDDYEHILTVLQNMVQVMERSPSAFETMNEESIRSHFLVQLNGHYEGNATGETFNYDGKTDILIRVNGRNIFIAECKFWSGPKALLATVDQLLGYSSWRDTKVAILLFNRNRDFSKTLAAAAETMPTHPNFKRLLPGATETLFRYVFAHRDDRNRELFLSVLAFDVPQKSAA